MKRALTTLWIAAAFALAATVAQAQTTCPDSVAQIISPTPGSILAAPTLTFTAAPPAGVSPAPTLAFDLGAAAPDPAATLTQLPFTLANAGVVRLRIYGLRGERVRTLVDGERPAGPHAVTWDGRDDHGRAVNAGVYFYRLEGFGQARLRRLVWLR